MRVTGFVLTIVTLSNVPVWADTPTFSKDVAPILYKHCAAAITRMTSRRCRCMTYKEARPWAASIKRLW